MCNATIIVALFSVLETGAETTVQPDLKSLYDTAINQITFPACCAHLSLRKLIGP